MRKCRHQNPAHYLAYQRAWAKANPDKISAFSRQSYIKHRAACLAYSRSYYAENRDTISQYKQRWFQENRQRILEQQHEYRRSKRIATACGGRP